LTTGTASGTAPGHTGIKVLCGSLTKPTPDKYVVATGISSLEVSGPTVHRLLRVRHQSDLVYY